VGFVLLNQCCRSLFFFLLVIVLSIVLKFIASDYPFVIFWLPLCYLLIAPLISWLPLCYLLITPLISSDYPFDIFWLPLWYLLITPLLSSDYPFDIFKLCLPITLEKLYSITIIRCSFDKEGNRKYFSINNFYNKISSIITHSHLYSSVSVSSIYR
jgi:hypothetical protein